MIRSSVTAWLFSACMASLGCDSAKPGPSIAASSSASSVEVRQETSAFPARSAAGKTAASAQPTSPAKKTAAAPKAPEGMVFIPAGIFLMGANALRGNPEEKPAHEAIVASFFLDQYEVTHGSYKACVEAGACPEPRLDHMYCNRKLELKGATDRDKYPANCIELTHADAYCRWAGKRLPTEREWEYAATAGDRRPYSWGSAPPTRKNCCYDNPGSCVGGQFPPGAFGLYDMTGNVWEWTSSEFLPYPSPDKDRPISARRKYVYRGGSWSRRFPKWMRTMLRNRYKPDGFSASIGVRCAQSIAPMQCPKHTKMTEGVCKRTEGQPMCEEGYSHAQGRCRPHGVASLTRASSRPPRGAGWATKPTVRPSASASPSAEKQPVFSRTRTPAHDADCRRHWPGTPASYIFRGGPNYPSRKGLVARSGCVPRDMGAKWTSACCKQ